MKNLLVTDDLSIFNHPAAPDPVMHFKSLRFHINNADIVIALACHARKNFLISALRCNILGICDSLQISVFRIPHHINRSMNPVYCCPFTTSDLIYHFRILLPAFEYF